MVQICISLGLLLIAGVTQGLSHNSGKIVGGSQANPGQFPYNVQLQWWGNHLCGGAVIYSEWIITAAHCAIQEAISYTVVVNQHNLLIGEDERRHRVTKLIQHPDYVHGHGYNNDIALFKVDPPIEFDDLVQPVALPPANHTPPTGSLVNITGWGALWQDGISPAVHHWVEIPTISDEVCQECYNTSTIYDTMICAGFLEGGHDSCGGDSGGPVVGQDLGYKYLVGIVSWGLGCAQPNYPGVNTDVGYFVDWIEKTIQENSEE